MDTPPAPSPGSRPSEWAAVAAATGADPGRRATLVQFSSAFCRPCQATRQVLRAVAARADGVRHLEVDAESHLDLVRELRIEKTPTVLVVDASGRTVGRAVGVPRTADVAAALERLPGPGGDAPRW